MPVTFTLKYETIDFAGGSLSVRGIAVPEIAQLVSVHTEAAVTLWDELSSVIEKGEEIDISALMFSVLTRFHSAITHLIALAADASDDIATIAMLPADVQLAALQKIATRSFAMEGGAKKFWETIGSLALANDGLANKVSGALQTFTNGYGSLGGK